MVVDPQDELEVDLMAEPNNRWSEGAPCWLPAEELFWPLSWGYSEGEEERPVSRAEPQGKSRRRKRRMIPQSTVRVRTRRTVRNTVEMIRSRASVGPQEAGSRAHCLPETGPLRSLIATVSTPILTSLAAAPGGPERK